MSGAGKRTAQSNITQENNVPSEGGPRAMSRVLRLFGALAEKRSGMTLSELGNALNVPKSTFVSSLRALVANGFLIYEGNVYRLGPSTYRLASAILSSWSQPDIVRYYVRELASATNESVGFAIADWEIGQAIFTEAINSTQPVRYAMHAGIRAPLYVSSAGRVLLAFSPAEQCDDYLARAHFRAFTPATRTTPESIREHLAEVQKLGYCASFGEMLNDTAAIAVPVFDASDKIIGALMVAAPVDRMRLNYETLLSKVITAGRRASGLMAEEDRV
jgi:IclR family transcriptional regulator, acetate operon repressor